MTRDIVGLGKKKQSVIPDAQDLAIFFTENFHILYQMKRQQSCLNWRMKILSFS